MIPLAYTADQAQEQGTGWSVASAILCWWHDLTLTESEEDMLIGTGAPGRDRARVLREQAQERPAK
jgi:hypothetical protein